MSSTDALPPNTGDINDNDNTGDNDGTSIVTVWQSIYIKNQDGSSYWYNAPEPFTLSIFGSKTGDEGDLTRMSQFANTIWMQPQTDSFTSWKFSCKESIIITDLSGKQIKTIVDSQTVNIDGQSAPQGQNTQITSAGLTEAQLEKIISLDAGQYYLTIAMGDIFLTVQTDSGESKTLTSGLNGSQDQVLRWLIEIKN
jgi:hypothetical protein